MPQGHHHHENKRDKRNTRLMQIAKRERENRDTISDRPIAVIDIGEKRISEIIREITGNDDDKYQDAWCKILTSKCETEDDIRLLAIQAKNENVQPVHYFSELSLQKPITHDSDKPLTIEQIIASPELVFDEPEPKKIKRRKYSQSYLQKQGMDDDVVEFLRRKFPDESLKRALRMALGLPTTASYHWRRAEIDLLIRRYNTASVSVENIATEMGRSVAAIRCKAQDLGLKKAKHSRITPSGSYNREDILKILHISSRHLNRIVQQGLLPWRKYKNLIIFSHSDIVSFIKNHPFYYRHDLLDGWKRYVPNDILDWVGIDEAASKLNWSPDKVRYMIKCREIPVKYYGDGQRRYFTYLRLKDANNALDMETVKHPFRVAWQGQKKHYVYFNDEDDLVLACMPHIRGLPRECIEKFNMRIFTKSYPNCLKCLQILKKYRETNHNSHN